MLENRNKGACRKVLKRLLIIGALGAALFAPLARALGLGDIEVYSALNQPLSAEIPLTGVRPGELDNLIVRLASEDAFARAGLDRPYVLSKLRFELATKPDGRYYIAVRSEEPIREPFLTFLLDVEWPRGRLLREYTLLLDPPVFAAASPAASATPARAEADASAAGEPAPIERAPEAAPLPAPDREVDLSGLPEIGLEQAPAAEPAAKRGESSAPLPAEEPVEAPAAEPAAPETSTWIADETPRALGGEPAPAALPEPGAGDLPELVLEYDPSLPYDEAATAALLAQFAAEDEAARLARPAAAAAAEVGPAGEGEAQTEAREHRVQAGETLYEIGQRYKPAEVSVEQAMIALLRYNPDAFLRDNINDLKKGFVLRIPDREAMLAIDNAEAVAEVRRQYALWKAYRAQLRGAPVPEQDAQKAQALAAADGGEAAAGPQLKILAPGRDAEPTSRASGAQEGEPGGESLYLDLQLAREQLAAAQLEKQELQARIDELNAQIEKQQRLIEVQSEQLAALQRRLAELEGRTPESAEAHAGVAEAGSGLGLTLDASQDETAGGEPEALAEAPAAAQEAAAETAGLEADRVDESAPVEAAGETAEAAAEEDALEDLQTAQQEGPGVLENTVASAAEPAEAVSEPAAEQAVGADAETAQAAAPAVAEPPQRTAVAPRPTRPGGLAGLAYDWLPAPYNLMAADLLQTPVGLGAFGALLLLLVLLLYVAVKAMVPKPKPPRRSALIEAIAQGGEGGEGEEAEAAAPPPAAKPAGLGARLAAVFAPLFALFAKKPAAAEPEDADEEQGGTSAMDLEDESEDAAEVEDLGEIESFDDSAAEAASREAETAKSPEAAGAADFGQTQREAPPVTEAVPDEEDDVTKEADVYLGYGLYDQVEELLTQMIEQHPDKLAYQGKLLEAYFGAGKKAEFEALAAKLHEALGGRTSRIWDRAVAMGKEIAPENPLFKMADTGGLRVEDFAPEKPKTTDLDLGEGPGETRPDIAFDETVLGTKADFELDAAGGEEAAPAPSGTETTELELDLAGLGDDASDLNIDFNPEDLGLGADAEASEPVEAEAAAGGGEEEAIIDLDAELPELEPEPAEPESAESAPEEEDVDLDATVAMDLSFDLPDESPAEAESASSEPDAIELDTDFDLAANVDDTDFDLSDEPAGEALIADLDAGEAGGPDEALAPASTDTEFDLPDDDDTIIDADLDDETISGDTSTDEVATKLDLARAYLDIGDTDGAASTLEEVLAEGNEEQRREAEELLDQIAG
ncbi:MAG: hypothetical protein KatS3mg121_0161 [Gammaproteobacteria bacterium]|nr:MAG: hypothetical protein KatS3mg121_0161 [Gammaproteobacteria bacterium]